jgi:hypothetical protein
VIGSRRKLSIRVFRMLRGLRRPSSSNCNTEKTP